MKKLIPGFLRKLDDYLLLNYPLLWISKIHYVLFFSLILFCFSAIAGLIIPLNISQTQDLGLWYTMFTIIAIVGLCFWIYWNVIFNIEKKFGLRHWTDEYKVFLLGFTSVLLFLSSPFPFTAIYNQRVATIVSDDELVEDINNLNLASPYIINDLNVYESYYDSVKQSYLYDIHSLQRYDDYTPWYIRYDTLKFPKLLSAYQLEKRLGTHKKSDQEILKLINKHIAILHKYGFQFNSTAEFELNYYNDLYEQSPIAQASFNYRSIGSKYELTRCLENISDAKFNKLFIVRSEFLHFLFYACFYITLLLMLFKMVNWKQYIITGITLIILPILLFIISQLMPYTSNYRFRENAYMVMLSVVFFTALGFTLVSARENERFNAFKNICAQIVYLSLPVFPMLFVTVLKQVFDVFGSHVGYSMQYTSIAEGLPSQEYSTSYYQSAEYFYSQLLDEYWARQFELWFFGMMYGGLVVFLLAIIPLMKQLFVKQLALPRNS